MLKRQKKHIDKEQGKTKHEAPRRVNYRATQNKNNIGTILWFFEHNNVSVDDRGNNPREASISSSVV